MSGTIAPMLKLWRRHTPKCPHRTKGREYLTCKCPLWPDGELKGKRYRRALSTRDAQRALRKIALMESPEAPQLKPVHEAVEAFLAHCGYLEASTMRKYANVLHNLQSFCERSRVEFLNELSVEHLDRYRSTRGLARTASTKELQTLRQFFGFCLERKWITENLAKKIKAPANAKPEAVVPYTPQGAHTGGLR